MTEIFQNDPAQQVRTVRSQTTSTQSSIGAEFDTFLTLLTAQIRNQDPLAPLDSTQFVEQLATFSSLEQQVQTNSILESMAGMLTSLHASASSQWVGQTVAAQSTTVRFDGTAIDFDFAKPPGVDNAALVVRDSSGALLGRQSLDLSKATHSWDGTLDGLRSPVSNGDYFVEVELFSGGASIASSSPNIFSTVESVRVTENGVLLVTENGQVGPESSFSHVSGRTK